MSTRILFTGQTLLSSKDAPPQRQQQVEQLLQGLADQNGNGVPDVLEGSDSGTAQMATSHQFIVNGRRYRSIDEMPPAERGLFEQMRGMLVDQALGKGQSAQGATPYLPGSSTHRAASTSPQD